MFNFEADCVSGVVCSYIFHYSKPPSMFYLFWPDGDLDNEWMEHFVVSYDKGQEFEIIHLCI